MKIVEKTEDEINDVLNRCADICDEGGSTYPGASYEEGVEHAINWLLNGGDHPFNN